MLRGCARRTGVCKLSCRALVIILYNHRACLVCCTVYTRRAFRGRLATFFPGSHPVFSNDCCLYRSFRQLLAQTLGQVTLTLSLYAVHINVHVCRKELPRSTARPVVPVSLVPGSLAISWCQKPPGVVKAVATSPADC